MRNRLPNGTRILLLAVLALTLAACSAMQPPDASGPRANEPAYPLLFAEDPQRRDATLAALWPLLGATSAAQAAVELNPITATIRKLTAPPGAPLFLPKLGTNAVMNEEETREALRRFVNAWSRLIGASPAELSLVERVDRPDGTKFATYEQRPFRYPLRGDYGRLNIHFTSDRRVLDLSSTCIPNADRIQTTLATIAPKLTPEEAVKLVQGSVTFTDSRGVSQTHQISANSTVNASELVIYVLPSKDSKSLEFHLAYQIEVSAAPVKTVYVDAVKGTVLAAE